MLQQVITIAWAQFRTMRNHLPRTNIGAVLVSLLSLLWYGMFIALGVFLATALPDAPLPELRRWLPAGLLGVFIFWQLVPLFTLSSGWSLQLNKLQIYPVSTGALFGIEVFLRVTAAPEMIIVIACATIGLLRHPAIAPALPLLLLLFIPLNLFLSLGIRELILRSFARNRFRELFAVLLISATLLPQVFARPELRGRATPYLFRAAGAAATPWHSVAALSLGPFHILDLFFIVFWTALCYLIAKRMFERSLVQDDAFRSGMQNKPDAPARKQSFSKLLDIPSRLFKDPLAALLQKEFQSLIRMPRFRVIFGMACVFSVVIFIPVLLNSTRRGRVTFFSDNFLPAVTLYGLLLLSDVLILNVFGFDRRATQIYFVTPVPFQTVLRAKNIAAITFVAAQCVLVLIFASLLRITITPDNIINAIAVAAVAGLFFICVGNLMSVHMPRPIDPTQTFKKQAGGKMQLWFLACSLGMFALMAFAVLARWAAQSNWALVGVLLVEFIIGLIVYRVATESAVEHAIGNRERLMEALSKGPSPIGFGAS